MKTDKQTQIVPFADALQNLCKDNATTAAAKYLKAAVNSKGQWLANAIMFGSLAAATKQKMKGKFTAWLKGVCAELKQSTRTAYNYIYLAGNLLHKLQTAHQNEPLYDAVSSYTELTETALDEILQDEKATFKMLSYVLAAIPEPTLNDILRQSNAQAIDAENATEPEKHLSKKDLKALSGNSGEDVQLNFFNEIYEDFRATIEVPRKDKRFTEMPRVEMEQLGNYLIAQGREIVEIAKTKKD